MSWDGWRTSVKCELRAESPRNVRECERVRRRAKGHAAAVSEAAEEGRLGVSKLSVTRRPSRIWVGISWQCRVEARLKSDLTRQRALSINHASPATIDSKALSFSPLPLHGLQCGSRVSSLPPLCWRSSRPFLPPMSSTSPPPTSTRPSSRSR